MVGTCARVTKRCSTVLSAFEGLVWAYSSCLVTLPSFRSLKLTPGESKYSTNSSYSNSIIFDVLELYDNIIVIFSTYHQYSSNYFFCCTYIFLLSLEGNEICFHRQHLSLCDLLTNCCKFVLVVYLSMIHPSIFVFHNKKTI